MKNSLKNSVTSLENTNTVGDIIESVKVGMLTTYDRKGNPSSRPMYVQEVDEQGQIWFFTSTYSILVNQVRANSKVHITFSDSGKNNYLSATALASEVTDNRKMQELWNPSLKAWFKEGLETPGITLLKLQMQDAEYWASPNSAVVRIVGIVKAMVSDEAYMPGRHDHVDFKQ